MPKVQIVRQRYLVKEAFDYLTAGREYDFTYRARRNRHSYIDVRRTDGSGIGTYLQVWQFTDALRRGQLVEVRS